MGMPPTGGRALSPVARREGKLEAVSCLALLGVVTKRLMMAGRDSGDSEALRSAVVVCGQ